mgnify:CR=1 FL=1|jgi:hypothetical protein
MRNKNNFFKAITTWIILVIIVISVSAYFVLNETWIGPIFILMGLLSLLLLKSFKIKIETVYPDLVFGAIDNGVLIFAAVLGGAYAGVAGAIIGGAAGNTLTDGIGGLFEGHVAQNQRKYKIDNSRTPLSTMLGKITGCLFGAGAGLILVWFIRMVI